MKPKIIFSLLILVITFSSFAQSVNIEGDPYSGNPYADINSAIMAANDGDVILISGVHTETITFGKSITLRGADPTTDIIQAAASPASDGSGTNVINVVRTLSTDVLNVSIENLGIRHGNEGTNNGGGINVDKVTGKITLSNLIIEDNYTNQNGGGVAFIGSNADIIDCTIRNNNSTESGGGIIMAPNNASEINNIVNIQQSLIDNNEGRNGGGIYINGNNNFGNDYIITATIENSTISNNSAYSGGFAAGGGAIWSRAETWTTNDGGDGTSANVRLNLIHTTFYKNFHDSDIKSGIQGTGSNNTEFSAYNSIIVYDETVKRAINFANLNTIQVKNCILGGLNAAPGPFLDEPTRNNERGRTATFAGLSGTLSDEGGNTQVITIAPDSNSDSYCTAEVTEITLPTIDQTGYTRLSPPDAGAFEVRCDSPIDVVNNNVAAEAASFSWTASPSSNGYEYVVVLSGDDPNEAGDIVSTGNLPSEATQAGATGLANNTDYDFYIRTECGIGTFGEWSNAVPFTTAFQGNLFLNSRFTDVDGNPSLDIDNDDNPEWGAYGVGAEVDNIIGENIGFIADTEGVLRQDFTVIPGVSYLISFRYRWVSESSSSNLNPPRTPVIRNDEDNVLIETLPAVQTGSDTWYTYTYVYTHPSTGLSTPTDRVRFQIFKANDNNQLNFYNITVLENIDLSDDYDFVYKNGAWSSDIATSTSADELYVYNGFVNLDSDVTASNFEVSPWADVDINSVLDIVGTLTTDGKVTFKNDDTVLGQLSSGSISGAVTVERYNSDKRVFRLVSPSVDSDESIFINWQEGGRTIHNLGTHITGSESGENGFDETQSGNPSLFTFDNSLENQSNGAAWSATTNTDVDNLEAGKLYRILVRGDRRIDLTNNNATPNETRLRATGTLNTGNITTGVELPALSVHDGNFSAVGNPYQAIIDANNLTYNGDINSNFIYVWDATENTNGKYVTVSTNGSEAPDPDTSDASQYIMPGQGFFIRNNGTVVTTPSITFTEASKATGQSQVDIFSENEPLAYLNLRLYKTDALANDLPEVDAIGLRFSDEFTNPPSDEDASKLGNPDENLAIINDQSLYYIDNRSMPVDNEIFPLFINGYTDLNYSFKALVDHIPENIQLYLEDNYTEESFLIENNGVYSFSIDGSISESIAYDRFQIRFEIVTLSNVNFDEILDFTIYPNPVEDVLKIDVNFSEEVQSIEVYNQVGRLIIRKENLENLQFDVSQLQTGMYLIKLNTGTTSFTTKFLKK